MKCWIPLLLFFFVNSAIAQRPKIGLTLSGGGAKGLAHIGILKAIDSAGLKLIISPAQA
jgi:NTE family protein